MTPPRTVRVRPGATRGPARGNDRTTNEGSPRGDSLLMASLRASCPALGCRLLAGAPDADPGGHPARCLWRRSGHPALRSAVGCSLALPTPTQAGILPAVSMASLRGVLPGATP